MVLGRVCMRDEKQDSGKTKLEVSTNSTCERIKGDPVLFLGFPPISNFLTSRFAFFNQGSSMSKMRYFHKN